MSITVTRTKIIKPRKRPDLINRPRLLAMLDDLLDYHLTLVTAPAGYGKTSLLVDFAEQVEYPVCWLALDKMDQDLYRFLTHFVASIRVHFPGFGEHSLSVINNLNQKDVDFNRLVRTMVNDAYNHIQEHFAVVLDDYHLIDKNQEINQFISQFGQEVDENCHLIIASRTLLDLPDLPLMIGRSQVKGLSFEELAFRPEEIRTLLLNNYRQPISIEDAHHLAEETEGWITGLLLSAETMADTMKDRTRVVKASGIDLYDYLAEQVLDQQPRNIRDFLLKTSHLEEFNAGMCQDILGAPPDNTHWSELINHVLHQNLFVLPVENGGPWIRYHHLFCEFLQNQIKKERPAEEQQILRRLITYSLEAGQWDKAHQFGKKLGDLHLLADLIEQAGAPLMKDGRMKLLRDWIDDIPDPILANHPALLARYGAVSIVLDNPNLGLTYLKQAEILTSQEKDPLKMARIYVWQATAHHFLGSYQRSLSKAVSAQKLIQGTDPNQQLVLAQAKKTAGLAYFRLGKFNKSLTELQDSKAIYQSLQDDQDAALATMDLGLVNMQHGNYTEASRYFQQALTTWQESHNITHQTGLHNNLGVLEHLTGNYDQAYDHFQQAVGCAQQSGFLRMEAFTYASLGDLFLDLNDYHRAGKKYTQALQLAKDIDDQFLIRYLELMNGKVAAGEGKLHKAHLIFSTLEYEIKENGSPGEIGRWCLEKGRLAVSEEDYSTAAAAFLQAAEKFSTGGNQIEKIHARVLLSFSFFQLGNTADAEKNLKLAFQQSAELESQHPLVAAARDLSSFLEEINLSKEYDEQRLQLITAINKFNSSLKHLKRNLLPDKAASPDDSPVWEVKTFGRPKVMNNGQPVTAPEWVNQKSARELFFYLLAEPQGKSKEVIGVTLWPESTSKDLKRKFKNAVYRLRRALGKEMVIYNQDTKLYSINRRLSLQVDTDQFEQALSKSQKASNQAEKVQHLKQAVSLYVHPYLAGKDALWVQPLRTRFYQDFKSALFELTGILFEEDQFSETIEYCQRLLEIDPCQEEICRLAMRAYAAQGDRSAAARLYQRCQEAFTRLLDANLSAETEALYQELIN